MDQFPIVIEGFSKIYGNFTAVQNIDFQVERGEIFGLLGPNGAGKTTTLECLEGIRQPSAGRLRVLDVDPMREPQKLARLIGVQLQSSGLHPGMTVDEAMKFFCTYHGVKPRYDLVERLGLQEKRRTQYSNLSIGLQRRLNLALAVAHNPPVVILDEPTAGLDVSSRVELHSMMDELRKGGSTILLATHDMAEAEKMADRVAILLKGQIVAQGAPIELTAAGSGFTKVSVRTELALLSADEHAFPGVRQRLVKEDYTIYYTVEPGSTVSAVIEYITAQGDKLIDLRVERPSLEERFLEITTS
jgi:ABC-2 type transport system ATP-binding protein